MRVAEIHDNKIVLKDRDKVELNGREGAIVKVVGCGLCGSDIVKFKEHISNDGTVLGHEIVAEIVEINSKVLKPVIKLLHHIIYLVLNVHIVKVKVIQCVSISKKQILNRVDLVNMYF